VILQLLFSLLYIPISLVVFNQVHPASFLANLLAVPWVSLLIVPLNFLLLLLFWLPEGLLNLFYSGLDFLLSVLTSFLSILTENGLSAIDSSTVSRWWLMLFVIAVLLLLQPGRLVSRFLLLMALPLFIFWQPRHPALLRMTVLDVGMGTSIVLQTREHSLVYDFGPGNRRDYSLGRWVVMPFLQQAGIAQPDRIILSHTDQDHIGGFYAVQQTVRQVPVFSGMQRDMKIKMPQLSNLHDCHQTAGWSWDQVRFEFLSTQHPAADSDNDRSCVLKVTAGSHSILLTGDIEQIQEQRLLRKYASQLSAEVMVVPHHGSLTSSSTEFIQAVAPKQVIFTSGFLNRWKFPREKIIERYRRSGALLHNTAVSGAVAIECDETGCRVDRYRHQHWRIWY